MKNSTKVDKNKKTAKARAAEKVGLSDKTANKAAEVVKEIDRATASGEESRAAELRRELNEGSVSAAHRNVTGTNGQKREQARIDTRWARWQQISASGAFNRAPR